MQQTQAQIQAQAKTSVPALKKANSYQFTNEAEMVARIVALSSIFFIPFSETLNNAFGLAIGITFFAGQLPTKLYFIARHRLTISTLLLVVMLALGIFHSSAGTHTALHQFWKYSHKILYMFLLMPLFIDPKWRRHAVSVFIVSIVCATLCYDFHTFIPWQRIVHKSVTLFINPIPLSILSAFTCFTLFNRIIDETRWRSVYLILYVAVSYFLFFVNNERTGMLVYFGLAALFFWQRLTLKFFLMAVLILPVAAFALFFSSSVVKTRLLDAVNDVQHYQKGHVQTSIGLRLAFIDHSVQLIKQQPWFGHGTGSFAKIYDARRGPVVMRGQLLGDPHNTFFHIAVQLGLVGLLVFLFWLLTQWRLSHNLPPPERYLAQGMIVAFTISSFCIAAFLRNGVAIFYLPFLGIFFAALPERVIESVEARPFRLRRIAT